MAKKLLINDKKNGFTFNVKVEGLAVSASKKPKVIFKNDEGDEVKMTSVDLHGKPLGKTQRHWLDENGNRYDKKVLHAYDEETGDEIAPLDATNIFEIAKYEPIQNYTNSYIIEKYYEVYATEDKDLLEMKKFWEYLMKHQAVAKAEFIATSGVFNPSAAYIRPIEMDGKWTLELGVFKEKKEFSHLIDKEAEFKVKKKAPRKANTLL